jgi:hypothetical protein
MQIPLAISVLCFMVLVGSGIAIMHHIGTSQRPSLGLREVAADRNFSHHFLSAVKESDRILPRAIPRQTVQDITARKSWNHPSELVNVRPNTLLRLALRDEAGEESQARKKSAQSTQNRMERLDWTYFNFNKNMGSFTDPYEIPRARSYARTPLRRY